MTVAVSSLQPVQNHILRPLTSYADDATHGYFSLFVMLQPRKFHPVSSMYQCKLLFAMYILKKKKLPEVPTEENDPLQAMIANSADQSFTPTLFTVLFY